MLKLLIKYDMKSISKIAIPMYIASGIISLLCCAVLYYTFGFAEEINSMFKALMQTGGLYLIGTLTIAMMIFIVWCTVVVRYYKSIFTDQGYLNMMIPTSKRSYLDSKIISGVIWFVISGIVAWACVFISVVLPTLLYDTRLISLALEAIKNEMGINNIPLTVTAIVIDLLISVIALAKDVVLIIAAVTFASVFVKRFKVVACVVFYFMINFVEELFVDGTKAFGRFISSDNEWMALIINSLFEIAIILTVAVVMYIVTLYVLEKKLDLE